jgi:hypothetical protein
MNHIGKSIFQIILIIAFIVGSAAYWSALGIVALFIWLTGLTYAGMFRLYKAFLAFFQVLVTNQRSTKNRKSVSW